MRAFTATSRSVPVRSMSPRITSASWLKGVTESTRSLELTVMERLGFTSSITTESTALAPRQLLMPKAPQHMTTRAAATARGRPAALPFSEPQKGGQFPLAGRRRPGCGPADQERRAPRRSAGAVPVHVRPSQSASFHASWTFSKPGCIWREPWGAAGPAERRSPGAAGPSARGG